MTNDVSRKPNYMSIYMFGSIELDPNFDVLLQCLEDEPVFAPETWGPSENVRLAYKRGEVVRALAGRTTEVYLVRKRVVKYEAAVDIGSRTEFRLVTGKAPAEKHWPVFFELADQLAAILKPRFATVHIVWSSEAKATTIGRLRTLMNGCGVAHPVEFHPNGPLGLGIRTYFGDDVLRFVGRDTLLGAPAHVSEQSWGGVRIDLYQDLDELDGGDELVHKWKAAMDYFRPKDVFAPAKIKRDRYVDFEMAPGWLEFERDDNADDW
jgi:hypothetical protein